MDDVRNSVRLYGKAYAPNGSHVADWRSAAARLNENNNIRYVRECTRFDIKTTEWLPGLGEVDFDNSIPISRQGEGKFWDSHGSRPEETVIKRVKLRRSSDDSHAFTMESGSENERASLVRRILENW